jgi:hypothetical protein
MATMAIGPHVTKAVPIGWYDSGTRDSKSCDSGADPILPPSILAQAHSNAKGSLFEYLGFVAVYFSSLLPLD